MTVPPKTLLLDRVRVPRPLERTARRTDASSGAGSESAR